MISTSSRYANQPVTYYLDGRTQTTRPTVMRVNPYVPTDYLVKASTKWQEGARVDRVGSRLFGKPDRWWVFLDENPEILDPMSITAGTTVVFP